jgi:hypothetical protein
MIGQYFSFGYPMPPAKNYLKRIILYYDKIAIPDFNYYAEQYSNLFNRHALDDWLEDLATKYYRFEELENAGLIEYTDFKSSNDKSPFFKAHSIDCIDENYQAIIREEAARSPLTLHAEFLVHMHESLLSNRLKRALKENIKIADIFAWFMNSSTIDSLNYALFEAARNNTTPTTDSPIAEALLNYKYQRVMKSTPDPSQTLSTILELTVPHFESLPLEQILKIRKDFGDPLKKFRKEVDRINELVNREPVDQEEKIRSIVETEINPDLVEIRKIQLGIQPKVEPGKMVLKGLLGRIPYMDLLLNPIEAIKNYRKQRELHKHSFYLLSLL